MSNSIDADFAYLGEVLRSDLPDSDKLFFAALIVNTGFRFHFGYSRVEWADHCEWIGSIHRLAQAGFIEVVWDGDKVYSVFRRARTRRDTA